MAAKLPDGTYIICSSPLLICVGGIIFGSPNVQPTSTHDEIVTQAYKFLQSNLITGTTRDGKFKYSFCQPSSYKYGPSQWLWGTFPG